MTSLTEMSGDGSVDHLSDKIGECDELSDSLSRYGLIACVVIETWLLHPVPVMNPTSLSLGWKVIGYGGYGTHQHVLNLSY